MKNGQVMPMLKALEEIGKFEAKDLDFAFTRVKLKKILIEAQEEFNETMKEIVKYEDDELELSKRADGLSAEEQKVLEAEDRELTDRLIAKNKLFASQYDELMNKEFDKELPEITKEQLPKGITNTQVEILFPLFKQ